MKAERLFVAGIALLVFALWRWGVPPKSPPDARIAQLEAKLQVAEREVERLRQRADEAAHKVATRKHALQVADTVIRLGLKSAERAIEDTALSADSLRVALGRMVTKVTMYQAEVLRYQESVDTLLITHLQERQALLERVQTLEAMVQASAPTPCTYFGVRCPNRTTAFVLGVGAALVLTLAVVL